MAAAPGAAVGGGTEHGDPGAGWKGAGGHTAARRAGGVALAAVAARASPGIFTGPQRRARGVA
jgi:hypothetical protein